MKKKQIMVVEDERIVADDIKMSLLRLEYAVPAVAVTGEDAVKKAKETRPDLVLMDIVLQGKMDGIEATAIIQSRYNIPVVYLTAYADEKTLERAKITEPFGYILKPFEDRDLHTTIEMALHKHKIEGMLKEKDEKLQRNLEDTVMALASAVEKRDPYTAGHQRRVTQLACAIAKEMGLSKDKIEGIRLAGIVHDTGKMLVPAEILSKPGKLTTIDFSMIKTHPEVGHDILKEINFPYPVAKIILQHHERLDGSGYPSGLSGEKILIEARVIGVADVVEAITSRRPYRAALGTSRALKEISNNKGVLYEPDAVKACLKLFEKKGFKFNDKQ